MLTGRVPYPEPNGLLKTLAHREQPVPAVCRVCPDVPRELGAVVERMLAKLPDDRYPTPRDVAAALEPFADPALLAEAVRAP